MLRRSDVYGETVYGETKSGARAIGLRHDPGGGEKGAFTNLNEVNQSAEVGERQRYPVENDDCAKPLHACR
jgi:hypothetical protein